MVFGVMRLVNVVHGELLVLGAYLSLFISTGLGLDPLLATLMVAAVLFGIGYSLQLWVFNPLMDRGMEPPLLTAFGLSIIAQSLFLVYWTTNTRTINTIYSQQGLRLVGINVPVIYLLSFGLSLVLIAGIHLFLTRTYSGKAIRAATQDPETARVMGVNVKWVYALTYAIGAATTALGGTLIGMTFSFLPLNAEGGMGKIVGHPLGGCRINRVSKFKLRKSYSAVSNILNSAG